jgi:hypothetical protein
MPLDISFIQTPFLSCLTDSTMFEASLLKKEAITVSHEQYFCAHDAKDAVTSLRSYFIDAGIRPPDEAPLFTEIDRIAQTTLSQATHLTAIPEDILIQLPRLLEKEIKVCIETCNLLKKSLVVFLCVLYSIVACSQKD